MHCQQQRREGGLMAPIVTDKLPPNVLEDLNCNPDFERMMYSLHSQALILASLGDDEGARTKFLEMQEYCMRFTARVEESAHALYKFFLNEEM